MPGFLKKTIDFINEINFDFLSKRLQNMCTISNDPYINVYPSLIESISRQKEDIHSMILLAHMVYGWMPTIIKSDFQKEDSYLLQKIDVGSLENTFLLRMKECINNSIVGTSKFLHFKNPQQYAIWDSKVYRSITGKKYNQSQINNIENFIAYTKRLRFLASQSETEKMKTILIKKRYCNENASNLRVIEIILFYSFLQKTGAKMSRFFVYSNNRG